MRYHDFQLDGYTVRDLGRSVVLQLSFRSAQEGLVASRIEFTEVSVYHFVHTTGAILLEIDEQPIREFVPKQEAFLTAAARQQGLRLWHSDLADYTARLEQEGLRAWVIGSAIGFAGFVIARGISGTETVTPLLTSGPTPSSRSEPGEKGGG
jgi:hypothetical protein